MGTTLVYITCPSLEEARSIARSVVGDRLAACANIVPAIESLYWWQGALEESREVLLLLKTKATLFERLEQRVRELHGYECPCIVGVPLTAGSEAFLRWVADETLPDEARHGGEGDTG